MGENFLGKSFTDLQTVLRKHPRMKGGTYRSSYQAGNPVRRERWGNSKMEGKSSREKTEQRLWNNCHADVSGQRFLRKKGSCGCCTRIQWEQRVMDGASLAPKSNPPNVPVLTSFSALT